MVKILREADRLPVAEVSKKHGVSEQTIYTWRKRFGAMNSDEVKRLRQLEADNARLKKMLANQDGWDRYEAANWLTLRRWLEANPDDELAEDIRAKLASEPERHAAFTREYLGWGVFALMPRPPRRPAG